MFYGAYVKRQAMEQAIARNNLSVATMTAALYSNTNLDSKENKGIREQMITEIRENSEKQISDLSGILYKGIKPIDEDAIPENDPFYSAMKLPYDPVTGVWHEHPVEELT